MRGGASRAGYAAVRVGIAHGDRRTSGAPRPDRRARGGAVDGRAPVRAVRGGAPGGGHTTLDAMIAADPVGELGARVRGAVRRAAAVPAQGARRRDGAVHPGAPVAAAGRGRVTGRRTSAASRRATSRATTSTTGPSRRSCARSRRSRRWPGMRAPAGRRRAAERRSRSRRARARSPRTWPRAERAARRLTEALAAHPGLAPPSAGAALVGGGGPPAARQVAAGGGEYAAACAAAVRLAEEHPGDLGIVASLLLRHSVLQPGEAVFLPAGGRTPTCTAPAWSSSPTPTTWCGPG